MSVHIRHAHHIDCEAVFKLASQFSTSFQVEHEALTGIFDTLLNNSNAYLGVAEREGKILGYVLAFAHPAFYANGEVAWVEEIMVETEARRQHIGLRLMQSAEDWAHERGCKLVALATRRAAHFYQAVGYEESATYFRKLL